MLRRYLVIVLTAVLVSHAAAASLRQPQSMRAKAAPHPDRLAVAKRSNHRTGARPTKSRHQASEPTEQRNSDVQEARQRSLAEQVRRVLDWYYAHPLNTRDDVPWSILHWAIAYGVDAQVCEGGPGGRRVTAIGWLCCNRPTAGKRLVANRAGEMTLPVAPGIQGHHGQFLSMLAQSNVPSDYFFHVGGEELKIADLVEYEKNTCRRGMELTFKLTGISHYTPSTETWRNGRGEIWSVEKLLREELKEPINRMEACCGGTHRLFALSYALARRRQEALPITGPWEIAARRLESYQRKAFQMQNRNGSFSTMWLDRREQRNDRNRQLTTSGHLAEWLVFSLPEDRLQEASLERALGFIASLLEKNRGFDWHPGALGHALHALSLYEQRVLGAQPGQRMQLLGQLSPRRQPAAQTSLSQPPRLHLARSVSP